MIAQGYADRPFSDLVVETDRQGFADTVAEIVDGCRRLLAAASPIERPIPTKPIDVL